MLIREALGEAVPTGGIAADRRSATYTCCSSPALVDELALTDDELDELIADAEAASARDRAAGWRSGRDRREARCSLTWTIDGLVSAEPSANAGSARSGCRR